MGARPGSVAALAGLMAPVFTVARRPRESEDMDRRQPLQSNTGLTNMKRIIPLLVFSCLLGASHLVYLSEDGGYRDIVVKISDTLDMKKCSNIISGIKVRKCSLLVVNILI